ncbi:type IX secretion system lipoprotein PorK/GldK [Raineya sp.]|jgi:gliding motility-associated lipoprotein GldK
MNNLNFRNVWLASLVVGSAFLQGCGLLGGGKKNVMKSKDLNDRIIKSKGEIYRFDVVRPGWDQYVPQSMVVVPAGTFHMGQADEDVPHTQINYNKQITISAFFMDETEVTNNQYRLFTEVMTAYAYKGANGGVQLDPDYEANVMQYVGLSYDQSKNNALDSNFLNKIFPDTLRWSNEYAHHMGDPMMEYYFMHPAFDDYPVVGVKWTAAQTFCQWRTLHLDYHRAMQGLPSNPRFRLPTEAEWEYAARGGRNLAKYPWGNPYVRNTLGCMLANFKPGRGNYYDDGFAYTAPVASYFANDWGLYDMAGNVAEWCQDAYYEAAVPTVWDMNPVFDPQVRKGDANSIGYSNLSAYPRRVVRGGSWKDIAYFLETGTRTYQHFDSTSTSIGFRCAMTYLGRSSGNEIKRVR